MEWFDLNLLENCNLWFSMCFCAGAWYEAWRRGIF